ncbi:hypothetical protein NKDENANG_00304 [Candidatus Entotheonellaceae bacterium PAL068K]
MNSSNACSVCGPIDPRNRISQAVFHCVACEHTENADINAAKVIVARGARETQNGRFGVKSSSEAQSL